MQLVSANPSAFFAMTSALGDTLKTNMDEREKRRRDLAAGETRANALGEWAAAESSQPMATLGNLGAGMGAPAAPGAPVRPSLPTFAASNSDAGRAATFGALGAGVANKYDPNGADRGASLREYVENGSVNGVDPEFQRRALAFLNDNPYGVGVRSGFRSVEKQQELWNAALAKYGSPEAARKWVAPPGSSNHNHGQALDLSYESPEATQWAHQNAAAYGLKFPLGNENWHVEPAETRRGSGGVRVAQAGASDAPMPGAGQFLAQRQAAMDAQRAASGSAQSSAPSSPVDTQRRVVAIQMLLRNPETAAFGQQMWQALAQPKSSRFDFAEAPNGQWVRIDKETGVPQIIPGFEKTPSPVKIGAGETIYDPKTWKPLASGEAKDDRTATQKDYEAARAQGFQGTIFDYQTGLKRSGATNVSVETKGEQSFAQENGKALAKMFAAHAEEGGKAADNLNQLETLRQLGDQIGTGGGAALQAWAAEKGIKLGPNAGKVEAYTAIIDRMTPQQRVPGAGATSDFDAKLMKSSLPRLINTPGGNALIIDNLTTLQQNAMKRADVAMRVQAGELSAQQGILAMRDLAKEASGINQTVRDAAMGRTPIPASRPSASPRNPSGAVRVSTPEQASRLPKGTRIILPDGSPGIVP